MKKLRRTLSADEKRKMSRLVCENLFASGLLGGSLPGSGAENICVYMDAFGEVETGEIINRLAADGKKIFVPCVDGDDIFISPLTKSLERGAFGIREPQQKERFDKTKIDVFLIPALAFDRSGSRVGFGRGYYDKLLCGTNSLKIGLIYSFQLTEEIRAEKHDIKADYIITESTVINCGV